MRKRESVEILEADYHRNGVSGEGFYVGILKEGDTRKLVICFDAPETTAVLDLDKAASGNIYMYPPAGREQEGLGGNAWRGDLYSDLREDLKAKAEENYK